MHECSGLVFRSLEQCMSGGRPGDLAHSRGGGSAIVGRKDVDGPFPASERKAADAALDLHDRSSMRRQLYVNLLTRRIVCAVTGKHQLRVGVFVVDPKQPSIPRRSRVERIAGKFQKGHEVRVVTELSLLGRGALTVDVETGRVREEWVAPSNQYPR